MEGNSIPRSRSLFLPFVTDSDPNYFVGGRSWVNKNLKLGWSSPNVATVTASKDTGTVGYNNKKPGNIYI